MGPYGVRAATVSQLATSYLNNESRRPQECPLVGAQRCFTTDNGPQDLARDIACRVGGLVSFWLIAVIGTEGPRYIPRLGDSVARCVEAFYGGQRQI